MVRIRGHSDSIVDFCSPRLAMKVVQYRYINRIDDSCHLDSVPQNKIRERSEKTRVMPIIKSMASVEILPSDGKRKGEQEEKKESREAVFILKTGGRMGRRSLRPLSLTIPE